MKTGFTLIELLVVVLIIGILAAVAVPQYRVAVLKSRVAAVMPGVRAIADAAELYFLANGEYAPDALTFLDISDLSGCEHVSGDAGRLDCGDIISYNYNAGASWHSQGLDRVDGYVLENGAVVLDYSKYLAHSPTYAGETHCQAATPDAHRVCKNMGGVLISGSLYRLP